MLFNTPIFFVFLLAFLMFYGFVFLRHKPRIYFILVSSLVFYGTWNYRFIPLLVGSAVIDYFLAQAIGSASDQGRKKRLLIYSIIMNLGILALFKYADFVISSVAEFLGVLGYTTSLPTLSWVLPVGISFYTFQSLSYTIDVYRGDMKARKGLAEFTTALAFFPQLVAGPILRAKHILPQFHKLPLPTWNMVKMGFLLITVGLFKKTIADLLVAPVATTFNGATVSLLETWTGVLAFAGQIYGDFSGYSDMAIGIALLIGFKIPLNFRLPYFALSPVDFWKRWHISLSSWLRDYLYISIGGKYQRTRNIMITMLLGGLWHGAAWTFVAWGFFHGMIIIATHKLAHIKMFNGFASSQKFINKFIKWLITFYLIMVTWVFFRATSMDSALDIFLNMHNLSSLPDAGIHAITIFVLTIVALLFMHLMDLFVIKKSTGFINRWWIFWPVLVLIQGICLLFGEPSNAFIYFQF